jgi:hypothetical protein
MPGKHQKQRHFLKRLLLQNGCEPWYYVRLSDPIWIRITFFKLKAQQSFLIFYKTVQILPSLSDHLSLKNDLSIKMLKIKEVKINSWYCFIS